MINYWWKKVTLRKFASLQRKILSLEKKNRLLSDEELKKKVLFFRQKLYGSEEKIINQHLVLIFSLIREVIYRKVGLLLFPTQIFGGIVLHYGNIAQMNTGEGKTLTGLLPIFLNALSGKPVYVSTVNEYLVGVGANLAREAFGDIFKIGVNSVNLSSEEKKDLYDNYEIIYTTASELGFDYLRSNLVSRLEDKINIRFSYLLMDEVDSLAIDEAQNPLIISQWLGSQESISQIDYERTNYLAQSLVRKKEYKVNEKDKEIWLTAEGIKRVENFLQIDNLFSFEQLKMNFLLHNSLKAKHFYIKDVDYIVDKKTQKIIIIDSLTGRLVSNRVYSAGIQQAVECKEEVRINPQNKATATITYQNFFRLFKKLAGMTGTAQTEAEEFRQVYGMEVISIPPYKKLIRRDHDDLVFQDKKSKYQSIIKKIEKIYQSTKRPILVGSPSLDVSEHISWQLSQKSIPHQKLNAVNHQEEAEIVKKAGQLGAITISTNMAGRGTDIVLTTESRQVGGLLVIGAERNFSRRIDNQLRGRAGRQGDPGESQFYVSLEDEIIKNHVIKEGQLGRFFGKNNLKKTFQKPLSGKLFNMLIAEPQEVLRNAHTSWRQYTLNYDLLINDHRQNVYNYRNKILASQNILKLIPIKKGKKLLANSKVFDQEINSHLKSKLVKEIDLSWANYLETIEKINRLVWIKNYLPESPQEAFFWEASSLFQLTRDHIDKQIKEILIDKLKSEEAKERAFPNQEQEAQH